MPNTLTLDALPGDILIGQYDREFCFESAVIDNTSGGADLVIPLGSPITLAGHLITASELTADSPVMAGLTMARVTVLKGEIFRMPVYARGPGVVNKTRLPAADYAGGSFTANLLGTRTAAHLPNTIVRTEPANTTEQTT
jgi:hypothetical protein